VLIRTHSFPTWSSRRSAPMECRRCDACRRLATPERLRIPACPATGGIERWLWQPPWVAVELVSGPCGDPILETAGRPRRCAWKTLRRDPSSSQGAGQRLWPAHRRPEYPSRQRGSAHSRIGLRRRHVSSTRRTSGIAGCLRRIRVPVVLLLRGNGGAMLATSARLELAVHLGLGKKSARFRRFRLVWIGRIGEDKAPHIAVLAAARPTASPCRYPARAMAPARTAPHSAARSRPRWRWSQIPPVSALPRTARSRTWLAAARAAAAPADAGSCVVSRSAP